ncbi:MAG: EAL domain-containing protein [[Clostridium] innocuum]
MRKDSSAFMKETLKKCHVPSRNIIVEMTESYMVKSSEELQAIFQEIRSIGVRIAMDDFGTGYSSLGVLKNSPADIVKIDRIFIKDILNSEFDATFIQFVVRLCHDVNIRVLLEGVETKAEYEKVKTMGLDDIQGYYFGKPMHPEKLEELLR